MLVYMSPNQVQQCPLIDIIDISMAPLSALHNYMMMKGWAGLVWAHSKMI